MVRWAPLGRAEARRSPASVPGSGLASLRGHGARVGELSLRLARELGDDPRSLAWCRLAGALHDVGKIVMPRHVLDKPGALTASELALVRTHPVVGWDLCRRLALAPRVLDAILHHHERRDGSGYPAGLAERAIPYAARVVALADAFDAITSQRPYRPAMPTEDAMALLRREHAEGKWDPSVFAALEAVVGRGQHRPAEPKP